MVWSLEQVDNLQRRQSNPTLHPYTCPECSSVLKATPEGWICFTHGLVQTWAQNEDLQGENNEPSNRSTLFG